MTALTLEQILEIHALVVEATGGSTGLRNVGRLEAVVATQTQHVFGEQLYSDLFDKAGAMIRGIIADQTFVDGNKRTGMLVGLTFIAMNDVNFKANQGAIEDFAVLIATVHLAVARIAEWLREHTA